MNRLYILLILTLIISCNEKEGNGNLNISKYPRNISVDVANITLGANENRTHILKVKAMDTGWEIPTSASWLSVTPSSGRTTTDVNVTAKENTSVDEARVAILNVRSTDSDYIYSKEIAVTQGVTDVYITPSESSLSFGASETNTTISIKSNVEWEATASESWVIAQKTSVSELNISATENLGETRSATIYLKRSGTPTTINKIDIVQSEAGVTSDINVLDFKTIGEDKTVVIEASASWSAYASPSSWISVSPAEGESGKATLNISVLENGTAHSRSGFVYIKIGATEKLSITVNQNGIVYSASTENLSFNSDAEEKTFTFSANTSWKVVSSPEWLDVTPKSGNTDTEIKVTSEDNPNTTPRTGTIEIGQYGFTGNKKIKISQNGKQFTDFEEYLRFPYSGSTQKLQVNTDGFWQAIANKDWIGLSPTSGTGTADISVHVDKNTEKKIRDGEIFVTVGETTKSITVVQDTSNLYISCDDVLTNSRPCTINISVASDTEWRAKSNVEWMKVTPDNGSDNADIQVSVDDNPSITEREGKITVTTSEDERTLSFKQPGRTLSVDCSRILEVYSDGDTIGPIIITTDGEYEITTNNEWIIIDTSDNTFTITILKDDSYTQRNGLIEIILKGLSGGIKVGRDIEIIQKPKYIFTTSTDSLSFNSGEEAKTFLLSANTGWEVVSSPSWMTVTPSNGDSNSEITVTTKDNPNTESRTDSIEIGITEYKKNVKIHVTQGGKYFADIEPRLEIPNIASTRKLKVDTDGAWKASTDVPWINLSRTSDIGTYEILISVEDNPDNERREGNIFVTVGNTTKSTKIIQNSSYFNALPDYFRMIDSTPDTVNVTVNSNMKWGVKSDVDWISITQSEGSGNAELKVSIKDNPSTTERTGNIIFTVNGSTRTIHVTQPGRMLTVDCSKLEFSYVGETSSSINITTDGKYNIVSSAEWAKVTQSGNTFTVTVSKNEGDEIRSGHITIVLTDMDNAIPLSKIIDIIQYPKSVNSTGRHDFDEDEDWNL